MAQTDQRALMTLTLTDGMDELTAICSYETVGKLSSPCASRECDKRSMIIMLNHSLQLTADV